MKKIKNILVLVAAAAMGFTACQKEVQEDVIPNDSSVVISFVAPSADTKTSVDASGDVPSFAWNDEETFAVLEQTDALAKATSVAYEKKEGKAIITAEFDANADKGEYKYVTVYPEGGYVSAENISAATLCLPAAQTMAEGSYDSNADLMVSEVVTTSSQPTQAQMLRFTRLAAVVKMSLKNFAVEQGDKVQSVIFAAEGKALAGNVVADLAAPHEFSAGETVSSVTVATESAGDVYFTVLPETLEAGQAYTVTVVTEKKLYLKTGTIPESKSLVFEAGMVTRFGVDMKDVVPSDKWVLVRDASTLKSGDVVAVAAWGANFVLGADMANNYPYASKTEVVKIGDFLYHPIAEAAADMLQKFVLVKRDNNRNAFDFYNGSDDYSGDEDSGFLWAPDSGSKYLKLQDYYSSNTQFDISIDEEGVATVIATNGTGSSKQMMYNTSDYSSSRYFHCYSEITDPKRICIYRHEGAVGAVPDVAANVTVPDADEKVTIAEEGAHIAMAIKDVVFNYVGDWSISVSSSQTWVVPSYVDGILKYTAEANTGTAREAMVTITASKEGTESLTWTFKLVQKGAPAEISIEEFRTKEKDLNAVYKLTGKITTIPTSATGGWIIEDENGNQAKISYLKTESGSNLKDNVDIVVGDVMTVTTVVTGTTKGSGGNSTYPSVYKGHYGLSASATGSVGYEGGSLTVNIAVHKNGHISAPSAITSAEVAQDGNPVSAYSFTDNGDGTATAVVGFGENTTGGSRKVELSFSAGSPLVVTATATIMQDVNPALKKGWWLVTDVADLQAGDEIIIAATGLDYAISTATNTTTRKSTAITKNGGALENVSSSVQQYALEIDSNGLYSFKGTLGSDANKYIYAASSSSNYMKVTSTLDDNGRFTISIDSNGAATIIAQGENTRNVMQYNNKSTTSPSFYCTEGDFGAVCLYKYYK